MKINSHERYGNGPSLATKQERLVRFGFAVLFASALGMLGLALWH